MTFLFITVAFVLGTVAAVLTTLLIHRLGWAFDADSPLNELVQELEMLKKDLSGMQKTVDALQKKFDTPRGSSSAAADAGEARSTSGGSVSQRKKSSNIVVGTAKKTNKEARRAIGKTFDDGVKVGGLKVPTPISGTKAAFGFLSGMTTKSTSLSSEMEASYAEDYQPPTEEETDKRPHKQYKMVTTKDGKEIAVWVKTEEEEQLLQEMKDLLGDEYTDNPKKDYYYDDAALMRFIRARKENVPAAHAMLLSFVQWCESYGAHDITHDDVADILRTHQAIFHGFDKQNRPIIICNAAKHVSGQFSGDQMMKCIIWSIMTVSRHMQPPVETFTCIIDYDKFSTTKNADLDLVKLMTTTLDPYFPERMGVMMNINYPWTLSTIWRMVKPWLDPVTAEKIIFVSKTSQLKQYIDESNLPKKYGGTSEWQPYDKWCGFEMCSREEWDPTITYDDKKTEAS